MKKLFFSLVVFAFLFNTGCQENMLNDPFDSIQLNGVEKTSPQIISGTIDLEGILVDPNTPLNEYYSISGIIAYEFEWNSASTYADPVAAYNVVISLNIKAEITGSGIDDSHTYLVSGHTKDALLVQAESKTSYFRKSFSVQDSKRRMNLVCLFEVNSKGLSLTSRWLEFPQSSSVDPD